jgi:hypothetical protein
MTSIAEKAKSSDSFSDYDNVVVLSDLLVHSQGRHIYVASERGRLNGELEQRLIEMTIAGPQEFGEFVDRCTDLVPGSTREQIAGSLLIELGGTAPLLNLLPLPIRSHTDALVLHLSQTPLSPMARILIGRLRKLRRSVRLFARSRPAALPAGVDCVALDELEQSGVCKSFRQFIQLARFEARERSSRLFFPDVSEALPFCDLIKDIPSVVFLSNRWAPDFLDRETGISIDWTERNWFQALKTYCYALRSTNGEGQHELPPAFQSLRFAQMEGWALRFASRVVCGFEWQRRYACRAGIDPNNVSVLPVAAARKHVPQSARDSLAYICSSVTKGAHPTMLGLLLNSLRGVGAKPRIAVLDSRNCSWIEPNSADSIAIRTVAGAATGFVEGARLAIVAPDAAENSDVLFALGSRGIPIAFLVRDGHSIGSSHPAAHKLNVGHLAHDFVRCWQTSGSADFRRQFREAYRNQEDAEWRQILGEFRGDKI